MSLKKVESSNDNNDNLTPNIEYVATGKPYITFEATQAIVKELKDIEKRIATLES